MIEAEMMQGKIKQTVHEVNQAKVSAAYVSLHHELLLYARARLHDSSLAQDLVQDAFLKALIYESNTPIKNIEAWLKQIVKFTLIDHLRSQQANSGSAPDDLLNTISEDIDADMEIHHLFAQFLEPFIATLPQIYAEALQLKDIEGKSVKELSKTLSITESAVKSRLSRGRQQLKAKLLACCSIDTIDGFVVDFSKN